MRMRRGLALTLAAVFAFATPAMAAPTWVPPIDSVGEGNVGVTIAEDTENQGVSRRFVHIETPNGPSEFICENGIADSGVCDPSNPNTNFDSTVVLPYCFSAAQEDCVESLSTGLATGDLTKAAFARSADGRTFPANTNQGGLPAGGTTSVFKTGTNPSPDGLQYAVQVIQRNSYSLSSKAYVTGSIQASVFPILIKSMPGATPAGITQGIRQDGTGFIGGSGNPSGCAFTEKDTCAEIQDFEQGQRFAISIRVSKNVAGWFKGRIDNPDIQIESFSDSANRITVAADPVSVPRLFVNVPEASLSDAAKNIIKGSMQAGRVHSTHPDLQQSISWIETFREVAKDTAASVSSLWSFATLDSGSAASNSCLADSSRVIGFVSTNATTMSYGLPEFKDGMLTYSVAGLHYAPDKQTLNEGAYDLVLRSDVARCLYGFTKAPISATVSVIDDNGNLKTAVTMVNEANGWVKLSAHGFTFSSPKVRVKLTQAPEATPTPSASPKPTSNPAPAAAKKVTITCVKGKLIKKVTAVSPKCPAGYKKK